MLKIKLRRLLSLAIILSLVSCFASTADVVYVAGAPSSTLGAINQNGINTSITNANNYGISQGVYPGSIGDVNDSPTTSKVINPKSGSSIAGNKSSNQSNIISNGYTWNSSSDDAQAPVAKDNIVSPGAHNNGNSGIISGSSNYGANYSGNAPLTNNQQNGQSENVSYDNATNNYSIFNMHNIGIPDPVISSDGAILVNATTKEIYYTKNPITAYAPAGLATLLTGYLLYKNKNLDDVLVVTKNAISNLESGANKIGLKEGDTITVKDALYALYVKSACDVANVIAENVSGSIDSFVALMNQTAKSFGTANTNFSNPTGLNNNAQITTVYDMAIIMSNIIKEPALNLILQTPTYTLSASAVRKAKTITSSNEFINQSKKNYYPGIVASKLGYTSKAKYTMASFIIHNNQYLVSIVMHSNNTQYVDSKRLLNFGKTAVDRLGLTSGKMNETNTNTASYVNASQLNTNQPESNNASKKAVGPVNDLNANNDNDGPVSQITNSNNQPNVADSKGNWQKDGKGWTFVKTDGSKATNEWIYTNGKRYCVDADGYMITGWREFSNGAMYYFNPTNGELRTNTWVNTTSGGYYLKSDGSLAKADKGKTEIISTQVGNYLIDDTGKAIQKVNN